MNNTATQTLGSVPATVLDDATEKLQTCLACGGGNAMADYMFGHECPANDARPGAADVANDTRGVPEFVASEEEEGLSCAA